MFILRDLLTPLQEAFSDTAQGQQRKVWFVYTLPAGGCRSLYLFDHLQCAADPAYAVRPGA